MGRVEEASGLGQQHKFLYPLTITDGSIAVHHISESLNLPTGGNPRERRPIQNEAVARALVNRRELGEVRLARRGRYERGSEDGDGGNDNHENHDAEAVRSRNDEFLFFGATAHRANIHASPIPAKEFPTSGLMRGMSDQTSSMSGGRRIAEPTDFKAARSWQNLARSRVRHSRISDLSLVAANSPSTIGG
jgi:hypothetical protein